MAEVVGVDAHANLVLTREETIPYDYLILATGIDYNYFGHEDWRDLAPGLASVDDADRIRGKILTAFESAEQLAASGKADPATIQELLTFVQVGAGTAGVEMAGTMAEMARMALAEDFRHIDPRSARIVLFEAAPRVLPTFPERLSEQAHRHLEKLGVEVRTNARVERVEEDGVIVDGERIASRTVMWTAGVVASPAGRWLGVAVDRAGRIQVNPDLSVPGHPNVFAVGDTAAITASTRSLFGVSSETPQLLPGVTVGDPGYQFHRNQRCPGTHPSQPPATGRRCSPGAPQAPSAASLPWTAPKGCGTVRVAQPERAVHRRENGRRARRSDPRWACLGEAENRARGNGWVPGHR